MENPISRKIGSTQLVILLGDITEQPTEAIVNAANPSLRGGGGVDGAIHRAGGRQILQQCQTYTRKHGSLPSGKAMVTTGGKLRAKYVIHTVGPVYKNEQESAPILQSAYQESLKLAEESKITSVSFPSISTGAYRYPLQAAAEVAVKAVIDCLRAASVLELVQIVCFTKNTFTTYKMALEEATEEA